MKYIPVEVTYIGDNQFKGEFDTITVTKNLGYKEGCRYLIRGKWSKNKIFWYSVLACVISAIFAAVVYELLFKNIAVGWFAALVYAEFRKEFEEKGRFTPDGCIIEEIK